MTQTQKAVEYLTKEHLSHIDMLEPIRRKTADILYAGDDGVVFFEQKSHACMISMTNLVKCQAVVDVKKYGLFDVHQQDVAEWIIREGKFAHRLEVLQAAYMRKETIGGNFEAIRPLSRGYINQVSLSYDAMDDKEYIEELIEKGQLWGIFENGKLAGFIGEHLEGSMGLLEILPEYRRKGYGYLLEAFLINHFLELGETPFCQIKIGNQASIALQEKIGMDISTETAIWIF